MVMVYAVYLFSRIAPLMIGHSNMALISCRICYVDLQVSLRLVPPTAVLET